MGLPEVVAFALNFVVMVRVRGPIGLLHFTYVNRFSSSYHTRIYASLSSQILASTNFQDPKGLKMRRPAFHQYRSGETTLSASGMLIPANLYDTEVAKHLYDDLCEGMCLVVTVASVVEPFLSPQQRENVCQARPELISAVRIDVMTEKISEKTDKEIPWLEAQLLSLVDIPASAHCLQSLVESSFNPPELGWEVGWSLASYTNDSQHSKAILPT